MVPPIPKTKNIARLMYVRNASGLVRDGAKLLHILVILFLVIYFSNRNIMQIIIRNSSKGNGSKEHYARNICMKAATPVLSDKFLISAYVNGFLYDLVLTLCYFMALKARCFIIYSVDCSPYQNDILFFKGHVMALKPDIKMLWEWA